MSMSKKDFIALADAFIFAKPDLDGTTIATGMIDQYEKDIEAVAHVLAASNPAFKRSRWLAYIAGECGSNGGPVKK